MKCLLTEQAWIIPLKIYLIQLALKCKVYYSFKIPLYFYFLIYLKEILSCCNQTCLLIEWKIDNSTIFHFFFSDHSKAGTYHPHSGKYSIIDFSQLCENIYEKFDFLYF